MNNQLAVKKYIFSVGLFLLFIISSISVQAQQPMKLMRGKYWIKCIANGALDRETTPNSWESLYPGDYNGLKESAGGWDNTGIYHGAIVSGQPVAWYYRAMQFNTGISDVIPTTVTRNYDLANPQKAEEYLDGEIGSVQFDATGKPHMKYTIKGTVSTWSQPGYDGFVIMDCTLTNTDTAAFNDFYYARLVTPNGPYRPSTVSTGWDKEYEWDATAGDSIGFMFYDGSTMPPAPSVAPTYTQAPGDSTGNAGDPGNIGVQGSQDFKLYSPYVYAYTFDMNSLPVNSNGQKKIWRKIVSAYANPSDNTEFMPSRYDANLMGSYNGLKDFLTKDEQPRMSWRTAYDSIQKGAVIPGAGNVWERNPRYMYGIGPYTIPPGGTLKWKEIFVAGQMDRNVSMKGHYEATRRFKSEGIADLKKSFHNAVSLIKGSYLLPNALKGAIPPPTPCNTPRTLDSDTSEIKVAPSAVYVNGNRIGGISLKWRAVHKILSAKWDVNDKYVDPVTKRADFAAYKIYRSDNNNEGPWTLIDSLRVFGADSLNRFSKYNLTHSNDSIIIHIDSVTSTSAYKMINYFIPADSSVIKHKFPAMPNVPYRYCVTSIDTAGNESAMTGYSYYPTAAEPNPSNHQSEVRVVPNPFRQKSGYTGTADDKRIAFVNIPSICTIRIYTLSLDLVKTIEHSSGGGIETWGSQAGKDYMLTDFAQNVQPGIYIYHIESHVSGHIGETSVGKLAIIK